MNLHKLLVSRRTIHDFTAEAIPQGALERALEAAVSAPNHRMTEPWRFVRVGQKTRKELLKIALDLKSRPNDTLSEASRKRVCDKVLLPAELLVVAQHVHTKPAIAEEDYASVACAIENLMLSFWAEDVGTKWSTGGVTTDERTYALLGVDPSSCRIVGFVWIGRSTASAASKPSRRQSRSDLLTELP